MQKLGTEPPLSEPGAVNGVPGWFQRAVASVQKHADVAVDGARVHYRAWGDRGLPGLVLVHGGAAHSGWWDHIAPLLPEHHVVALDLSGHGDSDRREAYGMQQWAREIGAVAAAEGLVRPVVVGHSMGGYAAMTMGVEHADAVAGVAAIDSPLNDQPPEEERLRHRRQPTRIYPTAEHAMERFSTLPPQDVVLPYIREHVARQSVHAVEGGWTWKFDPSFFGRRTLMRDLLPHVGCAAAYFRCEHGLVSPEMAREMAGLVPQGLPLVDIPDAGHHPMLDQPLALATGLRTLLALWPARA